MTEHQKIADTVTTSTTPAHSDHVVVPDGFTVVESAIDTDHVPKDSQEVAHLRKTEIEVGEDAVFNDGEETVTKGTEQIEPALSVPPHLRTGLQLPTTRPCSLQDSKVSWLGLLYQYPTNTNVVLDCHTHVPSSQRQAPSAAEPVYSRHTPKL